MSARTPGFRAFGPAGPSRRQALAGAASLASGLFAGAAGAEAETGVVRVKLETALGLIEVAADCARAPLSAGDFLKYVDHGLYSGGAFYRTVRPDNDPNPIKIDVIQGGLVDDSKYLSPVAHEPTNRTGLRHLDGTISLTRDTPGTGTAGAFFICIGDQPELDFGGRRNPDGQGFAAFGRVVQGMDVVRAIWRSRTKDPDGAMGAQAIASPAQILGATRA